METEKKEKLLGRITVEYFKELPDGSAIVTIEMDNSTKEFLIGEGFLAVVERSMLNSRSIVPPEHQPPKKKSRNVKT